MIEDRPIGPFSCGACKYFDPFVGRSFLGVCRNMGSVQSGDKARTVSGLPTGAYAVSAIVTDSAHCTQWEAKS